jgi:hypothetical protein
VVGCSVMSVSHRALGRSTVKLRLTRSSSVAWLTKFFLRFLGPGNPLISSSRMMDRISFLLTIMFCSRIRAARIRNIP